MGKRICECKGCYLLGEVILKSIKPPSIVNLDPIILYRKLRAPYARNAFRPTIEETLTIDSLQAFVGSQFSCSNIHLNALIFMVLKNKVII